MGLISEEYIVGCNNFFSHMKLALWNLLQNNIHPFLLLFCLLSSSGILGATEWGPNFRTFFVIINCSCYNFLQVDDVDKACPQIHKNNSVNCVLWSSAVLKRKIRGNKKLLLFKPCVFKVILCISVDWINLITCCQL